MSENKLTDMDMKYARACAAECLEAILENGEGDCFDQDEMNELNALIEGRMRCDEVERIRDTLDVLMGFDVDWYMENANVDFAYVDKKLRFRNVYADKEEAAEREREEKALLEKKWKLERMEDEWAARCYFHG